MKCASCSRRARSSAGRFLADFFRPGQVLRAVAHYARE
jgi:hypothetical protein